MANIVDGSIEWLKDADTGVPVGFKKRDGTEGSIVTAETNPLTGGIDFLGGNSTLKLPAGVTDLTALKGETRPKRWITSDAIPMRTYAIDHQYAYGVPPGTQHQLLRYDYLTAGSPIQVYQCAPDALQGVITFAWAGGNLPAGHVFICVQNKTVSPQTFQFYRSVNYGESFTQVLDFGVGAFALDKGFAQFKRGGATIYSVLEYNVRENYTTRPFDGSANDIVRLWESSDLGATWAQITAWNVGTHQVRHGHSIDVDPYSDSNNQTVYYGFGDSDAECGILRREAGAQFPADVSFSNLSNTTGFSACYGSQVNRTVGGIFTAEHYITATDQHTGGVTDDANLGIRLWKRDLSEAAHVDRMSGVDPRLAGHNWWFGIKLSNGDLAFLSQPSTSVGALWRGIAITTSADNGLTWHFSGWITAPASVAGQNTRVFAQGSNGKIFIGCDAMAGRPSGSGYCTLVCDISTEDFIESRPDILGPVFFVDHLSGSDSNNGLRPNAAWASVRKALQSSAITYGSVVRVLCDGDLAEPATMAIVYNAGSWDVTNSGVGPTDFPVQIRANKSYAARLNWSSGATLIGSGTHKVDIEFDGVGIVPQSGATNWWSSHSTEPLCAYRLKDAVFGSKSSAAFFYLKAGTVYAERATLRGGSGTQWIVAEPSSAYAMGLDVKTSHADLGGNHLFDNGKAGFTPLIDQSTFTGYGANGAFRLSAAATTKPAVTNSAFIDSYRPCLQDSGAVSWVGTEIKNSYIGAGAINGSAVAIPTATQDASNIQGSLSGPGVFGISPLPSSILRSVADGKSKYGVDRKPLLQPLAGASN